MTETFYDLLDVSADATTEEIEQAYRDAVKEVHPDVSDDVDASERTARLNKAKDVLTDETERARYDRVGHESYTSGTGTDSGDGATGTTARDDEGCSARRPGERRSGGTATGTDRWRSGTRGSAGDDRSSGTSSGRNRWDRRQGAGRGDRYAGGESRAGGTGGTGTGTGTGTGSPSARRQAAAGTGPGPNVDGSWNAWGRTRDWAVHRNTGSRRGFHLGTLFSHEEPVLLVASTFFLYPMFVFSAVVPAFPLLARVFVAACTVFTVVYLLSMPGAAVLVFGLWSVIVPVTLVLLPGVSVFSLVGVVGLVATWLPFGFSALTYTVLEPV